jgi:hypothetical protein
MREFGSLAVFSDVSFAFIPFILAQKESRRGPPSGCGALSPGFPGLARLYDARPLAFKPPAGFFPSLRVHAGDFAITYPRGTSLPLRILLVLGSPCRTSSVSSPSLFSLSPTTKPATSDVMRENISRRLDCQPVSIMN